eukprot:gene1295-1636_t
MENKKLFSLFILLIISICIPTNNALPFSASDKERLMTYINNFRATSITRPPPATPLPPIVWDAALEARALNTTKQCHYLTFQDNVPGFYNFGTSFNNITNPTDYLLSTIPKAYSSYSFYRKDCAENGYCLAAKMVVGAITTKFACAITTCFPNMDFLICMSSGRVPDGTFAYSTSAGYAPVSVNSTNISNLLSFHKKVRTDVKPKPSAPGLNELVWNTTLAANAQKIAESCIPSDSNAAKYNLVNEWKFRVQTQDILKYPLEQILQYTNVSHTYDYWKKKCIDPYYCDSYLWLIQNVTRSIGCGFSQCYDKWGEFGITLVCQYYPPAFKSLAPYRTDEPDPNPPVPTPDPASQSSDWTALNKVSPIKQQGGCGSCWAFSALASLESQLLIKYNSSNNNQYDLSEQQAVNCIRNGCSGGWTESVFDQRKNITFEDDYKYTGKDGTCTNPQGLRVIVWKSQISVPNTKADFIKALKEKGPIAIKLNADPLQGYRSGIFEYKARFNNVNHGVLLTGYNAKEDYWIIKNSWGTTWGESGYIKIRCDPDDFGNVLKYNGVIPVI